MALDGFKKCPKEPEIARNIPLGFQLAFQGSQDPWVSNWVVPEVEKRAPLCFPGSWTDLERRRPCAAGRDAEVRGMRRSQAPQDAALASAALCHILFFDFPSKGSYKAIKAYF